MVDFQRLGSPLDADGVELAPGEGVAGEGYGGLGSDDGGAVEFVGALQPRCKVHGVAHHGVVEAPPRSEIADQRLAGIDADPLRQPVFLEEGGRSVEFRQLRAAIQRSARRIGGMVGIVGRRAEHGYDGVAYIFVDISAVTLDDVGHRRKIFVHQLHQVVGRHLFRDQRKSFDVGEEHRHVAGFAAEFRQFVRRQHAIDDVRRKIERKALLQQAAVLVGDDEAEADRGGKRKQARQERLGDRQRQRVVEGDRGAGNAGHDHGRPGQCRAERS